MLPTQNNFFRPILQPAGANNLSGANLQGADLQGADLQGANFQGVHLFGLPAGAAPQ
ncbi:MAG: Pentapeptide repeat (8 copies) [Solimicrobium sp.]|jgi:uncharacterized protein YjbI with pentapeptide repeats|nr:Pentapeptide repeat (8 copies) [Solimicrobium sp.]